MKRGGNDALLAQAIVRLDSLRGGRGDKLDASRLECLPGFVGHLHAAEDPLPHDEHLWRGLEHGLQVIGVQGVTLLAPPSPDCSIRQDDYVLAVGLAVNDDAPKAVGFDLWCNHIVSYVLSPCAGGSRSRFCQQRN